MYRIEGDQDMGKGKEWLGEVYAFGVVTREGVNNKVLWEVEPHLLLREVTGWVDEKALME